MIKNFHSIIDGKGDIVELCEMKEDDEEGNRRKRLMNKRQRWDFDWLPNDPILEPFDTYLGGYQGLRTVVRFE